MPRIGATTYKVVDTHTAGEPTRIVVGGVPTLRGLTMLEKMKYFQEHFDHVRRALMWEPRGHRDMFGAVLTPACDPRAQIGVIFLDCDGYLTMCGHGSIGVVTMALEDGLLSGSKPVGGWSVRSIAMRHRYVCQNGCIARIRPLGAARGLRL